MYKFKKLIQNEFIKMHRAKIAPACLIMLVLAVLFSILTTSRVVYDDGNFWAENIERLIDDYRYMADNTNDPQEKSEYEFEISFLNYMLENELPLSGWRYDNSIYHELFWTMTYDKQNTEKIAQYEGYLEKDGFIRYATDKLKDKDLSNGMKWKYETAIALKIDPDNKKDFRYNLMNETAFDMERLAEYQQSNADKARITELENSIAINQYRIEHNIRTNVRSVYEGTSYGDDNDTFWGTMFQGISLLMLVGIFCIVIAGRSVASEFSDGTYKLLVLNPVKRGKILMAKYASVLLYGVLLTAVIFVLTALIGALRYGSTIGDVMVNVENGVIKTASPLWYLLLLYLVNWVKVLLITTLSFCISSLIRSQGAAVGFTVVIYLMGEVINAIFASLSLDFGRFTLFANWDLLSIHNGRALYIGQTIPFALVILAVHMFIFLLTAWDAFVRREL